MPPNSPESAAAEIAQPGAKPVTRRAHDRARHPRLARELATLRTMAGLYCGDHHDARGSLCAECDELLQYATRRLDRCVFGDAKPTCANCKVHCYNAAMREQVRLMMRYSGPRMLLRHPLLAIAHLLDGRRAAPELPRKAGNERADRPEA